VPHRHGGRSKGSPERMLDAMNAKSPSPPPLAIFDQHWQNVCAVSNNLRRASFRTNSEHARRASRETGALPGRQAQWSGGKASFRRSRSTASDCTRSFYRPAVIRGRTTEPSTLSALICRSRRVVTPSSRMTNGHHVFCFTLREDAEKLMARFGGEWFDPQTGGRAARWQLLRDARKRYYYAAMLCLEGCTSRSAMSSGSPSK
jgi:hypothetical protein